MQHHSVTSVSPSNKVQNLRVVLEIPKLVLGIRSKDGLEESQTLHIYIINYKQNKQTNP